MKKILKPLMIVLGLLLLVGILTGIELYFVRLPTVDVTTRLLLISLLTINVIALLTLMFFVGKSLFKLYIERQHKVLGYKFKIKLVTIFVVLTLIPSVFLFVAASGLATNYINRVFSAEMKEPFTRSVELARAFYDYERERVLTIAKEVVKGQDTVRSRGDLIVRRYAVIPADATDTIKDAFNGKEGTEVISRETGDVIRAVIPDGINGVIVVESVLPKAISERAEKLKELYEDYLKLEAFKEPMRLNYILILGFLTVLIVFTALWVSLKVSRGITVPIQNLAIATERVASGDLNVQVDMTSKDEIGLLINSFNQMVKQLREGKESLEKAYLESDKRRIYLENILKNINSGVIFLDNSGHIITVNKTACSILNIKQEDIIGESYNKLVEILNSEDIAFMVKGMEGREIKSIKKEVKVNINGENVILRVYVSGIRETDTSKALGMLVVFDDLTEVIKAQKMTAWQEVARRLAHEIKNPLTPIKLSAERIMKKWQQRDSDFEAVFEKSIKTIIAEVESLKHLVDVFSRYGKMPEINKTPSNILEIIDDVVALYKGYRGLEVNLFIDEGVPTINLDAEQFKRVLINIIDNAIKAMNGQGVIDISARIHGDNLLIDVADTGPGIKEEEKDKLFLPYFSKRKDGTGLGLAIANKIVRDHGGQIRVRDNKPHGSIFSVEVPII